MEPPESDPTYENIYTDATYRFVVAVMTNFTDSGVWYDLHEWVDLDAVETTIGSSKVQNYWGHAAANDIEVVAGSNQILGSFDEIFIEDQEEFTGLVPEFNPMDAILKATGPTHSITLIIDSLILTDLFQQFDPSKSRTEIESIFRASSNERATFAGGDVESYSLENALNVLGHIFIRNWAEPHVDDVKGGFANLDNRNEYHDSIEDLREWLADFLTATGDSNSPFKIEVSSGEGISDFYTFQETSMITCHL